MPDTVDTTVTLEKLGRPKTYDSGYEHSLQHYLDLREMVQQPDREDEAAVAAAGASE